MTKWIKVPSPGEFRGEGKWTMVSDADPFHGPTEEYYEYCKDTQYLPTHEGEEAPND